MTEKFEITSATPEACSALDRACFQKLVIEGGEVSGVALETNISKARALVVLRDGGVVQGVAALKRPQDSYRERIGRQSGFALPSDIYPYELGYVFLRQTLRGRHLSRPLIAETLGQGDGKAIFATIRADNFRMRATLEKASFVAVGHAYRGRQNREINLLVRHATG
jgi:RimJ/RimL family protein N-acetyltransferase